MTTVNYPAPVQVNGYACQNCGQVEQAKKNIDPANPAAAPQGAAVKPAPAAGTGARLDLVI